MLRNPSDKERESRDEHSELLFDELYKQVIKKREDEFAVRTNELLDLGKRDKHRKKNEGYGFPDFLLSINGQKIVVEVTTNHNLEDIKSSNVFKPGETRVLEVGIGENCFKLIKDKLEEKNFRNVSDFHIPIILVIMNNKSSTDIDEIQIQCSLNDEFPEQIEKSILNNPDIEYRMTFIKNNLTSIKYISNSKSHKLWYL